MFCFFSRRAYVVWPPRRRDLTPLAYYVWGTIKGKCNADKPETIFTLKQNIREAIGEIQHGVKATAWPAEAAI